MLPLRTSWLVLGASTLISLGSNIESTSAQTSNNIYEFSIPYTVFTDIDTSFRPDLNIAKVTDRGESVNALFGLTNFFSQAYAQSEFRGTTISSRFNANPAVFGIEGEVLGDRFFGGENELFTRSSGTFETDLVQGRIRGEGNLAVLGGTGIFQNATGTVTFTQENDIDPLNPTATAVGTATLTFRLSTPIKVPEPTLSTAVFCLGVTGAVLWRRRLLLKHSK